MNSMLCILEILVKLIVGLTALTVLLSFTVAWYERANARPDLIDRRFTLRGIGIALWLMIMETLSLLITILLRPFGWFTARIEPQTPGDGPPVILLHGLFQNRSCMHWLQYCLKEAGHTRIMSINTPPWRDIETLTEVLAKKVDELRLQLKVDKVHLVGHSMGGLIARNYVQHRGGAERVDTLVTLGSPHLGSKLAPFAVSPMGRTLLPGSAFLKEFNKKPLPDNVSITAIHTRYDNIVLPAENSVLKGANNVELDGMGHTALLFHPKSIQAVKDALTGPES